MQPLPETVLAEIAPDLPQNGAALAVNDGGRTRVDDHLGSPGQFDGEIFLQAVPRHGRGGGAVQEMVPAGNGR